MRNNKRPSLDRRDFLRASAAAGAASWLSPALTARPSPITRRAALRIGIIGCGGKGYSDAQAVAHEHIVALADVDWRNAERAFQTWPDARRYFDYRDMLEQEELDAVVVATPDHSHAPASLMAMERGLHVYCQKPLTHSVEEARLLALSARRNRVVTQMGNQGTAMPGFREGVEVIRSGAIGTVREVHVWTNRPIWPQGIDRPSEIQPVPDSLRWDLFLGPAPHRPYNSAYQPFNWRGWWDYGTGALGDMACHIMNLPYYALRLGAPSEVWAEDVEGNNAESAPRHAIVRYRFPARGDRPAVQLNWYEGGLKPPAELLPRDFPYAEGGSLLVGDEGLLYSADDYGTRYTLLPEEKFAGYQPPRPTLPRVPQPQDMAGQQLITLEWLAAIRGECVPSSHFAHAGPFTEAVLLGNLAVRLGRKVRWDAARLRVIGDDEAQALVRKQYARGFAPPFRFRDEA